ncbi:MAG: DUF4139 domain-containing protein [Usitatibacter sp.]
MKTLRPLAACLACALPAAASAAASLTIYSSAQPGSIDPRTFRNGGEGATVPGYALVREERDFTLKAGRNLLRVSDVPALIDPTTVSFASIADPKGTRVVEQDFEFDLTSAAKLLSRYLDREITVELTRGTAVETITGTLVGTQGGLTLKLADGSVRIVPANSPVKLPGLPGGLISKPTLVWALDAARAGTQASRFSYQTGGMTWWTDYNLTYSEPAPGACRVDVGAWVTIVNQSGTAFADARLKLMAGDVQRVQPPQRIYPASASMEMAKVARTDSFQEKAFFEYHLYTLGRATTLANNSTKQVELFPTAPGVGCEKTLVYNGQAAIRSYGAPLTERDYGIAGNKKVDVYLRVKNSAANGLGVSLPAGKIRVAKADGADGNLEFVGEDLIDHTARDETVQVKLGSAFDVVGERRQVDFRIDAAARWIEEDIEVKVRNQKPDEPASVVVREGLYRWSNWTVLRKTQPFAKEDSRTIDFALRVAPKGEAIVRYTVRYTW